MKIIFFKLGLKLTFLLLLPTLVSCQSSPENTIRVEPIAPIKTSKVYPPKNGFQLIDLLIPFEEIYPGGPEKDGIPAIDSPKFITPSAAPFLKENDAILGIVIDGIAKAYPIKILNYHEIVNDQIGETNFSVTYCPLCGSGVAFQSTIDGLNLTFGVSGLLYNSDVLLYDRQTESLWSQLMGKSVSGPFSGQELSQLPLLATSWKNWKATYPETTVLSTETGFKRNYRTTPYESYELEPGLYFPVNKVDKTFGNKLEVLGIELNGESKAYPLKRLRKVKEFPIKDLLGGEEIFIYFDKSSNSAYAMNQQKELILSTTLFWFAWYAFHPETKIFDF